MKEWGMSNRQIADSDLMRRTLGRPVSPTRVAHIANQPARAATPWEQIAEFERRYCGPDVLAPGDERSRRIWRELVYPRLEAASLRAEGTSGSLAEAAGQAPVGKKAVEVDLVAGLVRLLLAAEARHEQALVESLCKKVGGLVAEGRADPRLQVLAQQLNSGKVDSRLADELMGSAPALEGAAPPEGLRLRIPPGARTRIVHVELPFGSVHAALRGLRDDLIRELFKLGFLGGGQYSALPPVRSEQGDVIQALGCAFRLSARHVLRIVVAKEGERKGAVKHRSTASSRSSTPSTNPSMRPAMPTRKNPHAVALRKSRGEKGGSKGGKTLAAKMTPEERRERARKAAIARWKKAAR
jgi:hypothetical protein